MAVPKQHDVETAHFFLLFLKSAPDFFWYIFFLTLHLVLFIRSAIPHYV